MFVVVPQHILQTVENLVQKVVNGFVALHVAHFDGKNAIEAIFVVHNALKFLCWGEANAFAPHTSIALFCVMPFVAPLLLLFVPVRNKLRTSP